MTSPIRFSNNPLFDPELIGFLMSYVFDDYEMLIRQSLSRCCDFVELLSTDQKSYQPIFDPEQEFNQPFSYLPTVDTTYTFLVDRFDRACSGQVADDIEATGSLVFGRFSGSERSGYRLSWYPEIQPDDEVFYYYHLEITTLSPKGFP